MLSKSVSQKTKSRHPGTYRIFDQRQSWYMMKLAQQKTIKFQSVRCDSYIAAACKHWHWLHCSAGSYAADPHRPLCNTGLNRQITSTIPAVSEDQVSISVMTGSIADSEFCIAACTRAHMTHVCTARVKSLANGISTAHTDNKGKPSGWHSR